MSLARALIILFLVIAVSACGRWKDDPTRNWSASQLYGEAKAALNSGNYDRAVEYFEILEARFPFGRFAQQAQIEIPYAYYKAGEPESALAAVDRFIQLNPRHPNLDYAYYLRGRINYDGQQGFFGNWFPMEPAERDTQPYDRAFQDFARLVREFPDSRYSGDARERMIFIRDTLAEHEIRVAEFYIRRGAWVAASQRARYVIEHYEGAAAMPQALAILVRSYQALGLDDLAADTMVVMEINFPEAAAAVRAGRPITVQDRAGGVRGLFERLPFFAN